MMGKPKDERCFQNVKLGSQVLSRILEMFSPCSFICYNWRCVGIYLLGMDRISYLSNLFSEN